MADRPPPPRAMTLAAGRGLRNRKRTGLLGRQRCALRRAICGRPRPAPARKASTRAEASEVCVGAGGAPAGSSDTSTAALCSGRQCVRVASRKSLAPAHEHTPLGAAGADPRASSRRWGTSFRPVARCRAPGSAVRGLEPAREPACQTACPALGRPPKGVQRRRASGIAVRAHGLALSRPPSSSVPPAMLLPRADGLFAAAALAVLCAAASPPAGGQPRTAAAWCAPHALDEAHVLTRDGLARGGSDPSRWETCQAADPTVRERAFPPKGHRTAPASLQARPRARRQLAATPPSAHEQAAASSLA